MLDIKYLYFVLSNPLSRFPQGGKVGRHTTPSPLGEGWEGKRNYLLLPIVILN